MFNTLITPLTKLFGTVDPSCGSNFFGLTPWYGYLDVSKDATSGHCEVTNFTGGFVLTSSTGGPSPLLLIALAILDDLLRIAALAAVGFVIYGGIKYITSQGSPDQTKSAQQTVINALIGLVIAMFAAVFVSFLGNRLGGPGG